MGTPAWWFLSATAASASAARFRGENAWQKSNQHVFVVCFGKHLNVDSTWASHFQWFQFGGDHGKHITSTMGHDAMIGEVKSSFPETAGTCTSSWPAKGPDRMMLGGYWKIESLQINSNQCFSSVCLRVCVRGRKQIMRVKKYVVAWEVMKGALAEAILDHAWSSMSKFRMNHLTNKPCLHVWDTLYDPRLLIWGPVANRNHVSGRPRPALQSHYDDQPLAWLTIKLMNPVVY